MASKAKKNVLLDAFVVPKQEMLNFYLSRSADKKGPGWEENLSDEGHAGIWLTYSRNMLQLSEKVFPFKKTA